MSSIYGDSIFESNDMIIDRLINFFNESSKLFEEFDITIAEDGGKSFGSKIKETIKKVIQMIKDFLKWARTKVKDLWSKLVKKVKAIDLKKSLKDAENRIRNRKSTNESISINEATYEELQNYLKEKVNVPCPSAHGVSEIISRAIIDYKHGKTYKFEISSDIDEYDDSNTSENLMAADINKRSDRIRLICYVDKSIKDFIQNSDDIKKFLDELMTKSNDLLKEIDIELKKLEEIDRKINKAEINSIDDLRNTINAADDNKDILRDIEEMKLTKNNCTVIYNYCINAMSRIDHLQSKIDKELKSI